MLGGLADGKKVGHDEGDQVCAHPHTGVKIVLQKATGQLYCVYLGKEGEH